VQEHEARCYQDREPRQRHEDEPAQAIDEEARSDPAGKAKPGRALDPVAERAEDDPREAGPQEPERQGPRVADVSEAFDPVAVAPGQASRVDSVDGTFLAQETPAPSPTRPSAHPRRNELRPKLTAKQQALLALLSIVMVVSIFNFNVKAFTQFRSGQEASSSIGDPQRFCDRVGAVLSCRSWLTNDVVGALADVLTQSGKARDAAYSQPAAQVAAQLDKRIADKDLDPRTYIRLGALYNLMADVNRSSLPKAETVLEALIQLAPKWPESYDALGETYLLEGRNDEALGLLRKAVEINPDNGVALWMYAFPLIWTHHEQEGRGELEAAIRHYDYHNPNDLKRLVKTFYQFKDLPRAIQFEEELVQFEPADAAHRYTLAILYKASGNRLKALEEMQIAAQLDPRYGAAIGDFQREGPQ